MTDSQQILLDTWRDIDCGDRPPGANRPGGALQIIGAFGDAQTWRRRDRLDELGRDLGAVGIDDGDVEPAHDRAAKSPGQTRKSDQRDDNCQQIAGSVPPKKPDLAQDNQP
jgi:hypothetical protein